MCNLEIKQKHVKLKFWLPLLCSKHNNNLVKQSLFLGQIEVPKWSKNINWKKIFEFLKFHFNPSPFYEKTRLCSVWDVQNRAHEGHLGGTLPKRKNNKIFFCLNVPKQNFTPFCSAIPEIIVIKMSRTDTIYRGMLIFFYFICELSTCFTRRRIKFQSK
jgi:hypothetical protein